MDISDLKKYGLGAAAGAAILEGVDIDVVALLEFLGDNPIPIPGLADGHSATATGSSNVVIEVPSGKLTLTGHALTVTTSGTATC